jgi:hypothetical protein
MTDVYGMYFLFVDDVGMFVAIELDSKCIVLAYIQPLQLERINVCGNSIWTPIWGQWC